MSALSSFTPFGPTDYNFGMLPSLAAAAAKAVCAGSREACPAMVRTHLLSIMSSAVAPLYVIVPPNWTPIPISVNTLCIADVGGSKSPIHERMIQPLRDHARDSFARHEAARTEASAASAEQKFHIKLLKAECVRSGRSDRRQAAGVPTREEEASLL